LRTGIISKKGAEEANRGKWTELSKLRRIKPNNFKGLQWSGTSYKLRPSENILQKNNLWWGPLPLLSER